MSRTAQALKNKFFMESMCVCVCVCVCSFVDGFLFVRMYANDLAVGAKAYDRGGPCIGTTSMLAVGGDS